MIRKILEILEKYDEDISEDRFPYCACIGDDILDISLMEICEVSGCPADACDEVKKKATYICNCKGCEGAVRDFVNWVINNRLG